MGHWIVVESEGVIDYDGGDYSEGDGVLEFEEFED